MQMVVHTHVKYFLEYCIRYNTKTKISQVVCEDFGCVLEFLHVLNSKLKTSPKYPIMKISQVQNLQV